MFEHMPETKETRPALKMIFDGMASLELNPLSGWFVVSKSSLSFEQTFLYARKLLLLLRIKDGH